MNCLPTAFAICHNGSITLAGHSNYCGNEEATRGVKMQVLVGTHVVLANGGIMAPVGTHVVALAAKHHSCPFVVLTGLHKLSPLFPHDPSVTFNDFRVRPLDMQ